jgi:hypothetical protein
MWRAGNRQETTGADDTLLIALSGLLWLEEVWTRWRCQTPTPSSYPSPLRGALCFRRGCYVAGVSPFDRAVLWEGLFSCSEALGDHAESNVINTSARLSLSRQTKRKSLR